MELGNVDKPNQGGSSYGTFHGNQRGGIDNPLYRDSFLGAEPTDTERNPGLDRAEHLGSANPMDSVTGPLELSTGSRRATDAVDMNTSQEVDPILQSGRSHVSTLASRKSRTSRTNTMCSENQLLLSNRLKDPEPQTFTEKVKAFFSSLQPSDDAKSKRKPRTRAKIFILFVGTFVSTAIFAIHPEMNPYRHQLSVSRFLSPEINVTGVTNHYCIVKLYTTGSFVFMNPNRYSQNITFKITNPVTGSSVDYVKVIANETDLLTFPESTIDEYYDFCDDAINEDVPLVLQVTSTTTYASPITVSFIANSDEIYNEVIYAAVILVMVYVLIIFELVHRTLAAMIGSLAALAVLADLNMKPSLDEVLEWLDYDTLALLFGMMTIVAIFCESGFFDWFALVAFKLTKGRVWPLITVLCAFAAIVSAFLDNVTTILLLTPITIRLCEALLLDPKHILIILVMFSNIGGTATAIGDPPNVIIVANQALLKASEGSVNFTTFTGHMFVGSLFTTLIAYGFVRFMYRNKALMQHDDSAEVMELKTEIQAWTRAKNKMTVTCREEEMVRDLLTTKLESLEDRLEAKMAEYKETPVIDFESQVAELEEKYKIRDWELLIKSSIVIVLVILCFFLANFVEKINLTVGWIAILGAILLLVGTDYADLESVLDRVEWATLLFFAALFVLMEALSALGLIEYISSLTISLISLIDEKYQLGCAITIVLWISALASSFIDNIPFTTAMVPIVIQLANDENLQLPLNPLVYSLAFGACLGGNGTLIGASCNVVCAGLAENHGHKFSFWQFFKLGFPVMLVTTAVANVYLIICHVAIGWNV